MQRQTSRRNRRMSISLAMMVILLGSSVGCVSLKHHMQRHSLVTTIAETHEGNYFHCSHCGQIIPREGFSKCPRCFQVPVYHGYEPTCWRQWPEGWGCPPESVVNNPEFWQQGMLESDSVEELLESEGELQVLAEPVDQESADDPQLAALSGAVPSSTQRSLPQPEHEMVDSAAKPILTADPVPVDQVEIVADTFQQPTTLDRPVAIEERPAMTEQTEASAVALNSVPDPPAAVEIPIPEPVQVETPFESPAINVLVRQEPPPKIVRPTPKASIATEVLEIASAASDVDDQPAVQMPSSVPEPAFESVSRIPIPATNSQLVREPTSDSIDELDTSPDFPSLVRLPAPVLRVPDRVLRVPDRVLRVPDRVINLPDPVIDLPDPVINLPDPEVNVTAEHHEPKLVQVATKPAERMNPHDAQGPIPVRKVQLASDKTDSQPRPVKEQVAQEAFPAQVNRVALPGPVRLQQASGEDHPIPVRRIQLSELPVKILR